MIDMQKNIVVIPCFSRPEYLDLCLQYILKADNADQYEYLFAHDRGGYAKNIELIEQFPHKSYVVTPQPNRYKAGKQSYNVMNGLLAACSLKPKLVFYVEEDVFIGKDFFTFIEAIHAKELDAFEVITSHNVNSDDLVCDDVNAYYIKENTNVHQGIGNCFKADMLLNYLGADFCDDYFNNPKTYVEQYYPNSALNSNFSEQDGLIRRIIEKNGLRIAFTHVPRCFHAGFYGYNRDPRINYKRLTFEQKKDLIMEFAFHPERLAEIVQAPNLVTDSMPVALETTHTDCKQIEL